MFQNFCVSDLFASVLYCLRYQPACLCERWFFDMTFRHVKKCGALKSTSCNNPSTVPMPGLTMGDLWTRPVAGGVTCAIRIVSTLKKKEVGRVHLFSFDFVHADTTSCAGLWQAWRRDLRVLLSKTQPFTASFPLCNQGRV